MAPQPNHKTYTYSQTQIRIPEMFSMADVLTIEATVINELKLSGKDVQVPADHYYLEDVGQWLYSQYQKTGETEALLMYLLPLIKNVLSGNTIFLNGMPYEDAFQDLCCFIASKIDSYDKESGKLFTFITMHLSYRIMTITMKNTERPKDYMLSEYEIGRESNEENSIMDLKELLIDMVNRENVEYDFKAIYTFLLKMLIEDAEQCSESELSIYLNGKNPKKSNFVTYIMDYTGVSRAKTKEALAFLIDEYGLHGIKTNQFFYSITKEEE